MGGWQGGWSLQVCVLGPALGTAGSSEGVPQTVCGVI